MEISKLLSQPHDMNPGSAAPYLEGFAAELATVGGYLGSAVHFGGWVEAPARPSRILTKRLSRHSAHIAANVLDAAVTKAFREPIQHVFSASLIIYGNKVPSQRLRAQRPKLLRPSASSAIGLCSIGDWRW